jgi:hypothetical protein
MPSVPPPQDREGLREIEEGLLVVGVDLQGVPERFDRMADSHGGDTNMVRGDHPHRAERVVDLRSLGGGGDALARHLDRLVVAA